MEVAPIVESISRPASASQLARWSEHATTRTTARKRIGRRGLASQFRRPRPDDLVSFERCASPTESRRRTGGDGDLSSSRVTDPVLLQTTLLPEALTTPTSATVISAKEASVCAGTSICAVRHRALIVSRFTTTHAGSSKVGCNTVTSAGPVTVTGNGADSLLPPAPRSYEGLFSVCLTSGGSQQPVTAQEGA